MDSNGIPQPAILSTSTANPPRRFSQRETYTLLGYKSRKILDIFLNSDIDYRHFYVDPEAFHPQESLDELHQRYASGVLEIAQRAADCCLKKAGLSPAAVDLILACTCTGYLCPDLATRLVHVMGLRDDVQRSAVVGLGCAGALPTLQRACDHARAYPGAHVLMVASEICSACYYIDNSLETAVGNAICGDGAAAFLISTDNPSRQPAPRIVAFESLVQTQQMGKVGFDYRQGRLRIILAADIRDLAAPMISQVIDRLLRGQGLGRQDVRFWILHPGGRKVIDNVQSALGLSDDALRFSKSVLRNYGNMSSPTVMFVLEEVMRSGLPRPGDWGIFLALGPGMAAEAALLRW